MQRDTDETVKNQYNIICLRFECKLLILPNHLIENDNICLIGFFKIYDMMNEHF